MAGYRLVQESQQQVACLPLPIAGLKYQDDPLHLLAPYPDKLLTLYPVTPYVSDAHQEGERCLEPTSTPIA